MKCKANVEIYSRVVGYYRPVQQWNEGKQEEFKHRKTFKLVEDFIRQEDIAPEQRDEVTSR